MMDSGTSGTLHAADDQSHPFTFLVEIVALSAAVNDQRTITNRTRDIFPAPNIKDFSVQGLFSSQKECKIIMTVGVTKAPCTVLEHDTQKGAFIFALSYNIVVIIFGYWRTGKSVGFESKEGVFNSFDYSLLSIIQIHF